MSLLIIGLVIGAQSSLPNVAVAQQALAAADQQVDACIQARTKLWSTLPDDTSAIAEGTLYVCRDFVEEHYLRTKTLALALIINRGQSTAGLDVLLLEQKRDDYRQYRSAAIAIILNQQYNLSHKVGK